MRRILFGLLCLVLVLSCGVAPCHAKGGRHLISYVYHTASHDGVPGYGWCIVEGRVTRRRLALILWRRMLFESKLQPHERGPLISISPLAVSRL